MRADFGDAAGGGGGGDDGGGVGGGAGVAWVYAGAVKVEPTGGWTSVLMREIVVAN